MRVLSYNIRFDNPEDKHNKWENRRPLVIGNIKFLKARLIGLQECLYHQIEDIVKSPELGGRYSYIGCGRDDGDKAGEFSPILYDNRKIELIHSHRFWISEDCYKPGSKSWGTVCTRILTWGFFREKKSGKAFYFLNTHLDHKSTDARSEGTLLIKTFISSLDHNVPLVLVGDFNDYEPSKPIQNLINNNIPLDQSTKYLKFLQIPNPIPSYQNLSLSREKSKSPPIGPKRTFTGFDIAFSEIIDFIIINEKFLVDGYCVFNNHPHPVSSKDTIASDHYPVAADLIFN